MGKLLILTVLSILVASNLSESKFNNLEETSSIFKAGIFPTVQLNESTSGENEMPLKIFTPTVAATYSVLLFFHGTCLENTFYSSIFQFIASHGYIVVAPQLYSCTIGGTFPILPVSGPDEVEIGAKVANWLPQNLQTVLPNNIKANLGKLALSGHSRGGKSAFALALGKANETLAVNISALIGLDPVAGSGVDDRTDPKILTYVPDSFELSIPVTVIGTGLGNESACWLACPACAPNGVNHAEFYSECRAPATHFVVADYGHMDVLDDDLGGVIGFVAEHMCKNSKDPKDPMRRTVGGIIVSFLKANFHGNGKDFDIILNKPSVAPAVIDPTQSKRAQSYALF